MIFVMGTNAMKTIAAQKYTQRTPRFIATAPPARELRNQPLALMLVAHPNRVPRWLSGVDLANQI